MPAPLVSVIIPCYNQGRFLAEAIESALGQTYPHVEVVVVNDGSTDETSEVAARYEGRIKYIQQENAGRSAARNRGLAFAHGEWVVFLDADDWLHPTFLETLFAAEAATADVLYCGWEMWSADKELLGACEPDPLPEEAFHALLARNWGPIHCFLIKREACLQVGGWQEGLEASEDWEFFLRLASRGLIFRKASGTLACYRWYESSSSKAYESMWQTSLQVLKKYRSVHPSCNKCRSALSEGLRWRRRYCVETALLPRLRSLRARKNYTQLMGALGWAVCRDPALLTLLLERRCSFILTRLRGKLRAAA